jgi:hypothetical protein
MQADGGWVAGDGFNNRMAGHARGAIAINRSDGRVVIAIRTSEGGLQVWGDLGGDVPDAIQCVLDGR